MNWFIPLGLALALGLFVVALWMLGCDVLEERRLWEEAKYMTPKDAYRRRLVLTYLPQCQEDMEAIESMVSERFP